MPSEMVERCARAGYAADWPEDNHASWEETADDMRERYTIIARAVLEALREPSEPMVKEAWRLLGSNLRYEEAYRRLIDTALKETDDAR